MGVRFNGTTRPLDIQSGGYDTLSQFMVAKNILAVGAVADIPGGYTAPADVQVTAFSSFGPTDDGRIAPHVVANGANLFSSIATNDTAYDSFSGTSMAAPSVSGSLNLWTELYEQLHPAASPMWASTRKGIAIHTADEAGSQPGPDYRHGFGLFNAASGATLIDDNSDSTTRPFIKEVSLVDGDFIEFGVRSIGGEPLRVTICWTDPAGTPPADSVDPTNSMLVNDLDLRVTQGTDDHFPWRLDGANPTAAATRNGDNDVDNVEQVVIDAPGAGVVHIVKVTHKEVDEDGNVLRHLVDDTGAVVDQAVSIILSGNIVEPEFPLAIGSIERDATGVDLTWASVVGDEYLVESSSDLQAWATRSDSISAMKEEVTFSLTESTTTSHKFYRVRRTN